MNGIWSAVLTPVDESLAPDSARAVPYYQGLLERGCDGINVLGTTGEAMSFSSAQRAQFMEAIASSGLPMERVMAGTGAASLADAATLTRHAFNCGFRAALVMPPFFYRDAPDDAIVRFFDVLFERATPPRQSVLLYNFPRMSGIAFRSALVDRLVAGFPEIIAGMKDSSNDAKLQSEIITGHPELAVFPGSESDLPAAQRRGGAGCISGSVALWPELARAVFSGKPERAGELTERRASLDGLPFIAAVRYLTAASLGDAAWERTMPPNAPLTAEERRVLTARVRRP